MLSGASHPIPSRRHRSSSNQSTRSIAIAGLGTSTVSGIAPARDSAGSISANARDNLSRQNSVASSRRSEASSPSLSSSLIQSDHFPMGAAHRYSASYQHSNTSTSHNSLHAANVNAARSPTRTSAIVSARYEEAALHRSELDAAKRENEALKSRIRELERNLNDRRRLSSSHDRGVSVEPVVQPHAVSRNEHEKSNTNEPR